MGMAISLILTSCAKNVVDENNDLGSGDKSNLPVSLTSLIEHAELCKAIYELGGDQKDEIQDKEIGELHADIEALKETVEDHMLQRDHSTT